METKESSDQSKQPSCLTCQSSWKPNRRTFVQTSVVAAIAIPLLGLATSEPALGIPMSGPLDCADALQVCKDNVDAVFQNECAPTCENLVGLEYMLCRAGCNAAHAFGIGACEGAYTACIAAIIAAEVGEALAEATQFIAENIVVIGALIIIAGFVFLVVECAIATGGLCLIFVGAAAATAG